MSDSNLENPASLENTIQVESYISKKSKKIKAYLSTKVPSLITLSYLAMIYFIVIFYFYVKSDSNDFVWWGDINYQRFNDFGTHVAGIAAIFAFILVFATYKEQVKTNKEQAEYIKKKDAEQIAANLKQDEYIKNKEIQLTEQAKTIKQLVNDNKKQSINQINQLKTLATHIENMALNNQNQYKFAIQEKSFYSLLDYFDNTVSKFVLLKGDRLSYIQSLSLDSSVRFDGKEAVQQTYLDIDTCFKHKSQQAKQENLKIDNQLLRGNLTEETYNLKQSFWNNYLDQIRIILGKIDDFSESNTYIDLFKSKLSDEEKFMIIYILSYLEKTPNKEKLVERLEKHDIFDSFSKISAMHAAHVHELFRLFNE